MKNQQILASFCRVPVLFDRVLVRTRFKSYEGVVIGERGGYLIIEHMTGGSVAMSLIENNQCVVIAQH